MSGKRGSIVPGDLLDNVTDHHQQLAEFESPSSIANNNLPQLSWETLLLIAKKAMAEVGSVNEVTFAEVIRSFNRMLHIYDFTKPGNSSLDDFHMEIFGEQGGYDHLQPNVSLSILQMAETFDTADYPDVFTDEILEKVQQELDMCSNLVQSFNSLETLYHNLQPYRGTLATAINYIQNSEHVLDDEDTFI